MSIIEINPLDMAELLMAESKKNTNEDLEITQIADPEYAGSILVQFNGKTYRQSAFTPRTKGEHTIA
jgi:hypothetical protein